MTLQPTAILFPDAELWATTALRAKLAGRPESYAAGVKVSNAVSNPRPSRLVQIRRDGGAADGVFDNPRLTVNIFAPSEQDATDLARLVAALMWSLPGDGVCVRMRQASGPSSVPDATPRRLMSFEARTRGTKLT
jgi:hypothetical protein